MTRTLRVWGVVAFLMVVGWGVGQTSSWPPGPEHAVVKLWPKGFRVRPPLRGAGGRYFDAGEREDRGKAAGAVGECVGAYAYGV
ncbi:hypothetical protein [Tunturiibacter gelidiferens]|uniref:hypothetical protein n=1 Tax=Tunturiibacter gelidiferens TaxID=3069689 RepID=UPI003D9AE480